LRRETARDKFDFNNQIVQYGKVSTLHSSAFGEPNEACQGNQACPLSDKQQEETNEAKVLLDNLEIGATSSNCLSPYGRASPNMQWENEINFPQQELFRCSQISFQALIGKCPCCP